MNQIVINSTGDASAVFQKIEAPIPVPGDEQVLIKVKATSLNPVDIHLRKGNMPALLSSFPAVLHGDVSGVVESTGSKVLNLKKGDKVYGWTGGFTGVSGALADYMVADYRLLAKMPENISFGEAAALPLVSLTAYEAIFDRAKIQAGQKVLVYGGAGGVGHIAIQFAKLAGAEVFAVVNKETDIATVERLGATAGIYHHHLSTDEIVQQYTGGHGFDVVFDTVGNENLNNSFRAAKANGVVVSTMALTPIDLTPLHLKAVNFHVVFLVLPLAYQLKDLQLKFGTALSKIREWVEEGKVTVITDPKEFSFDDIATAHLHGESGKSSGKLVITN